MQQLFFGQILIVGAGGFIGSGLRFVLTGWVQRMFPYSQFPYGTLTVNMLGCLLIGYLAGITLLRDALDPSARLFLVVGVLGGFTTFSAFAFESLTLAQEAQYLKAVVNSVLQVVIGIGAAWLGFGIARIG